jgi:transcriptional regulator GlxA family with amidase domain
VLCVTGISAGIDLSLYFVKKLFGNGLAEKVAAHMEYNWKDKEFGTCVCGVD